MLGYNTLMDEIHFLAERLHQVRHFQNTPIEVIETIIKSGHPRNYSRGEIIFHEQDPCAGFFVLIKGEVSLSKMSPDGKEGILTILEPVIMFNEVSALDGGVNPITASAHTDIYLWQISYENFQQLLLHFPQVGISLLGVLARRNRQLLTYYGDLSFRSVQARLSKHLVDISRNGTQVIDRKQHTNQLIAGQVITTPEAVSRTLRLLACAGVIGCNRREITVLDLARLQFMAQIVM